MGAIIMMSLVTAIAIIAFIYYTRQDLREIRHQERQEKLTRSIFNITGGKQVIIEDESITIIKNDD